MNKTAIDTIIQSTYIMCPISGSEIFRMIDQQDQNLKDPLSLLMEYGSFDIVAVIMETVDRFSPRKRHCGFPPCSRRFPMLTLSGSCTVGFMQILSAVTHILPKSGRLIRTNLGQVPLANIWDVAVF